MDYESSFQDRTHSYLQAINHFPHALNNEFLTAIEMLQFKENDILLNIPAGGVPIKKYIDPSLNIKYLAFDTHAKFTSNDIKFCTWDDIPLQDNSVDKILCLASLHHLNSKERQLAFMEFYRILKKNGKLVIGDVIDESDQATWLNIFVNMHNSNGHKGSFFTPKDTLLLSSQGFTVTTSIKSYPWIFDTNSDATVFCKLLFGLDLLDVSDPRLAKGLENILHLENGKIPWQLIYFVCSPQ